MISRSVLAASLVLALVPLTAGAAIDLDGPGEEEPGDTGGGGGGGGNPPPPPDWARSYSKGDYWGSANWGAGYSIYGSVTARKATASTKDKLTAAMAADTYAKIGGRTQRLFAARLDGNTEAKAQSKVSFNAYVGSANVFTRSYTSTTSTYQYLNVTPISWDQTFFDVQANVSLIVPVSFRAKASGQLRVNLNGKISNVGIEAGATPTGRAGLYAYAAVGAEYCVWGACVGATAGVYADLTLLSASAPANVGATLRFTGAGPVLSGVQLHYVANAGLTVSSLDGELGVRAEACLGGCISDSVTLVDWNGFSASYNLINQTGDYCLAGDCTTFTPPPILK